MSQRVVSREARIGLLMFAGLSIVVGCNLFFMQGRRVNNSVETSAILRPDAGALQGQGAGQSSSVALAPDGDGFAAGSEAGAQAPTVTAPAAPTGAPPPPQPATRPLPTAVAPPASVSRTDMIRAIQKGLTTQGYEPGSSDGIMGLMTRAAIMAYESDSGLALTAEPSEELMRRVELGSKAPPLPRKSAPEVKTVEAASLIRSVGAWLSALGYQVSKNETSMSPALVRAIRGFEASQKMPETGRISAALVARLSRAGQARSATR